MFSKRLNAILKHSILIRFNSSQVLREYTGNNIHKVIRISLINHCDCSFFIQVFKISNGGLELEAEL